MVEVRPISFCMQILKANTYNTKKSRPFYLLYEESYNRLKLTYFSCTSAFTLDAHCISYYNLELQHLHLLWIFKGLSLLYFCESLK